MSSVAKVVNHGDVFEETGIQNKWKWEWLSKVVKVGETDECIGTHFRKIDVRGTARLSVPKMLHTAIVALRIYIFFKLMM